MLPRRECPPVASARLAPGRAVFQVARLAACAVAVGCYVGLRSLLAVDQLVRIFRKVGSHPNPIPSSERCVAPAAGAGSAGAHLPQGVPQPLLLEAPGAPGPGFAARLQRAAGLEKGLRAIRGQSSSGSSPASRIAMAVRHQDARHQSLIRSSAWGRAAAAAGLHQRPERRATAWGGMSRLPYAGWPLKAAARAGGESYTLPGAGRRAPDNRLPACQARPRCTARRRTAARRPCPPSLHSRTDLRAA